MFRKILVANRGEIAVRIIRAAREMGVETVAVFSEADRQSPHVSLADESICIGGPRSHESYLNMDAILEAAEQTEARAIHPGYGFLSENALFAARCVQHRITFIGPSAGSIRLMGDKAVAKHTMRRAGLPTIPGSEGIVLDVDEAGRVAAEVGYPVLLKATAGGGGRGMRVCHDLEELRVNFQEASMEAEKAFGNSGLYLEKFITGGRHIEFQILADSFGNVVHLGERECSIQRKNQKLVEESPSPVLTTEERADMGRRVVEAVRAIGYVNAGTVEFFRAPEGRLYFMEMNTRLQVEHPVTEMTTGVDIVKQQFLIAANYRMQLTQENIVFRGHAIECRINAEDPDDGFRPVPGTIEALGLPSGLDGDDIRFDSHVTNGYTIPPYYDSMIGKLIVKAPTRREAIARMRRALAECRVQGVKTTIPLHQRIMDTPDFIDGDYSTRFVPDVLNL